MELSDGEIRCADCGTVMSGDQHSPLEQRQPCNKCGSLSRTNSAEIREIGRAVAQTSIRIINYSQRLVEKAEAIQGPEVIGLQLILCVTACEVAAEKKFVQSLEIRGVSDLQEPMDTFLRSYDLTNNRFRQVFSTLSGMHPEKESFWSDYKKMVQARHKMVYSGHEPPQEITSISVRTATDFVKYLGQWLD